MDDITVASSPCKTPQWRLWMFGLPVGSGEVAIGLEGERNPIIAAAG